MRNSRGRPPGSAKSYTATRRGKIGVAAWLSPEVHGELRRLADERGELMGAMTSAALVDFIERAKAQDRAA